MPQGVVGTVVQLAVQLTITIVRIGTDAMPLCRKSNGFVSSKLSVLDSDVGSGMMLYSTCSASPVSQLSASHLRFPNKDAHVFPAFACETSAC